MSNLFFSVMLSGTFIIDDEYELLWKLWTQND